jgi:hypothetical protein
MPKAEKQPGFPESASPEVVFRRYLVRDARLSSAPRIQHGGPTMAAGANSTRNNALNDRRERAAGRRKDRDPMQEAIKDFGGISVRKGKGRATGAAAKKRGH